jgi:hypothetical protein
MYRGVGTVISARSKDWFQSPSSHERFTQYDHLLADNLIFDYFDFYHNSRCRPDNQSTVIEQYVLTPILYFITHPVMRFALHTEILLN